MYIVYLLYRPFPHQNTIKSWNYILMILLFSLFSYISIDQKMFKMLCFILWMTIIIGPPFIFMTLDFVIQRPCGILIIIILLFCVFIYLDYKYMYTILTVLINFEGVNITISHHNTHIVETRVVYDLLLVDWIKKWRRILYLIHSPVMWVITHSTWAKILYTKF